MHVCAFCNETIEDVLIQFGDVRILDDNEYWHLECYAEYFDEALEEA